MNTIVALGLSENQEPYLQQCKSLGYHVLGFDRDRAAKCITYCDEYYSLSINSVDLILEKIKGRNLIGILSEQTDTGLVTLGTLNSVFSLLGLRSEASKIIRDKYKQRSFIQKHSLLKQPIFASDQEINTKLISFIDVLEKPRSGQGSSGVCVKKLKEIIPNDKKIYEEFLDGEDLSIDGIFQNEAYVTAFCVKEKFKNTFVDKTLLACICAPKELVDFINCAFKKLNIDNVFFHAEFKRKDDCFYLIEFTTRGGGSGLSTIVSSYLTNLKMEVARIDLLIGKKISYSSNNLKNRRALMHFGKLDELQLVEKKVRFIPNVNTQIRRFSTANVEKIESGNDREACIYITFLADVSHQINEVMNEYTNIIIK